MNFIRKSDRYVIFMQRVGLLFDTDLQFTGQYIHDLDLSVQMGGISIIIGQETAERFYSGLIKEIHDTTTPLHGISNGYHIMAEYYLTTILYVCDFAIPDTNM